MLRYRATTCRSPVYFDAIALDEPPAGATDAELFDEPPEDEQAATPPTIARPPRPARKPRRPVGCAVTKCPTLAENSSSVVRTPGNVSLCSMSSSRVIEPSSASLIAISVVFFLPIMRRLLR